MAVADLPTPPFSFIMAMIFAIRYSPFVVRWVKVLPG